MSAAASRVGSGTYTLTQCCFYKRSVQLCATHLGQNSSFCWGCLLASPAPLCGHPAHPLGKAHGSCPVSLWLRAHLHTQQQRAMVEVCAAHTSSRQDHVLSCRAMRSTPAAPALWVTQGKQTGAAARRPAAGVGNTHQSGSAGFGAPPSLL